MKHKRLHHIGVIMPSIEKVEAYMNQFGLEKGMSGYVAPYHAHYIFTKANNNESPIEFLVPTEGVLTKYNNGKGGIHHFCYEVDDIEKECEEFLKEGYEFLEKKPIQASSTMKINFLRPKSAQGILVELVEITAYTEDYIK